MNSKKHGIIIVILYTIYLFFGIILKSLGIDTHNDLLIGICIIATFNILFSILLILFYRKYLCEMWKAFAQEHLKTKIGRIAGGYLRVILTEAVGILIISIVVMTKEINIGLSQNQSSINAYMQKYPALTLAIACLIGPFIEEMVFRGILYKAFSYFDENVAVVITALLFGLAHMMGSLLTHDPYFLLHVIPYLFMGIGFGWVYKKHKNIWINVLVHMLLNIVNSIL